MAMTHHKTKIWRAVIIGTLTNWFCSCSSFDLIPSDSLIQRLKGRGPVLVSQDNPYLAANLLLKQESQNSKELSGFLENRGMPSAITVTQDFFQAAQLKLFYRDRLEQYDLELLQGIWVINGPTSIEDIKAKEILTNNGIINQNLDTAQSDNIEQKDNHELVPLFETKSKAVESPSPRKNSQKINNNKNLDNEAANNIEEIISSFSSTPAEITPNGDIVHYVTTDKETLEILSKWYTKSSQKVRRIANANKLAPSAILRPGDQIIIPVEIAKNKLRLPEEALTSLAQ